jgi:AcrR family transcriptional regulator
MLPSKSKAGPTRHRVLTSGGAKLMHDNVVRKSRGGRTKKKRHTKRKGLDRATEIKTVALDLFAEKDYAAVTTTEIARIVGVRHSLIYYYFDNKDDLFNQTVESFVHDTLSNYEAMRKMHDDPVEQIEYWFENNIELSGPLRKLIKIMFDYSGPKRRPLSTDRAIKTFYMEERSILATAIKEGIVRGIFDPVDPGGIAAFVSTHLDGIFFSSLMRKDVDLVAGMATLKAVLWQILGYEGGEHVRPAAERCAETSAQ